MSEVLYRATKYMNAEDALLARDKRPKKRERQEDTRQDQGQKKARTGDQRDERRLKPLGGRFTSFTPLTAPIDQVLMQIKDEEALTFLGKLKSDPNKRSRDKQGKLQKFVSKEKTNPPPQDQHPRWDNEQPRPPIGNIRMIVGGTAVAGSSKKARKTYFRMVQNVQMMGVVPKIARREGPIIGFLEEDARRFHHPYDDALVVSLRIEDYNMHRVLVDNGSSAAILYYPAFQQMRIDRERLISTNGLLVGFGGSRVFPLSTVTLSVMVGDYPQQITKDVTFLVVDCSSAYNAILGRPMLNSWKVVTSTYHLMIKFPTDYEVGELCRSQMAAHECYVAMMEMEDQFQALSIEEHRTLSPLIDPNNVQEICSYSSWTALLVSYLKDGVLLDGKEVARKLKVQAARTTARPPTGEIPFQLTYEGEAVIPAEVRLTNYRVHNHDENKNDEAMRLQLDLVDEIRAAAE
ncbi:uncharacterized protein LOC126697904 [Quercus robur]|uniref:uncharacterized protein LOC126697904 n=1 Tax=Quercus robur TaxID=38942 RepID=UPI002163B99C|nr:uncharacterized protein LOC126697904 [Quercus robur]